MDDQTLSSLITLCSLAVFAVSAFAAFWMWRARRSGWATLADAYGARPTKDSTPRRGESIVIRPSKLGYPWMVTARLTVDGLHMSLMRPFNLGHEPLLIPWNDIEIFAVDTYPADRLYDLKLSHEPNLKIRIGVALAQGIRRAADNVQYFVPPTPPKSVVKRAQQPAAI
ncbi:MAG: hypothetical protein H7144_15970 [Burkholderiales bacterium]|nr:hypothetical protein [Phycisphaerae bacterium]